MSKAKQRKPASDDSGFVADDSGFVADDAGFTPDADAGEPENLKQKIARYLQMGAKGLDYAGGAVRGTAGAAMGKVSLDELKKGLTGQEQFPSSDEILKRAGVGDGKKLSDVLPWLYETPGALQADRNLVPNAGGDWDPSLRSMGGFALDVLTDPLTYISFGTAGAGKAAARKAALEGAQKAGKLATLVERAKRLPGMVASPVSRGMEAGGEKLYKNGLREVVNAGEKKGKDVVDVYARHGVKSLETVGDAASEAAGKLKGERDAILKATDAKGATVSRDRAMKGFTDKLDQMVADRRLTEEQATKLYSEVLDLYGRGADPSTMLASQWKTDIRRGLPQSTWNAIRSSAPDLETQLMKELGSGLQTEIEKTVGHALSPEKAAELASKNSDLGTFLSTLDKAHAVQARPRKPAMDVFDWLILSGEMMPTQGMPIGVFAAKKAYDVAKNPAMQTRMGHFLNQAGKSAAFGPALDIGVRRTLTKQEKKKDGKE